MKKIIVSLFTIFAVVAAVSGATFAVFSDTDSFVGNTISTATVNISALSEPKGLLPKPINVSGLVPGQSTGWARGVIFNKADSTDVRLYMHVANVSGAACGKTNLKVYTGHAHDGADDERSVVLYNGVLSGLQGPANRREITGHIFDPIIKPNNSAVIQQRAQLDSTAGNGYQGTSCTWDEVFTAETLTNPSPLIPTPTPAT